MNKYIATERLKEKAINMACQYEEFERWFNVDIDDKEFFIKAQAYVTKIETLGFGKYPDEIDFSVMLESIEFELVDKELNEYEFMLESAKKELEMPFNDSDALFSFIKGRIDTLEKVIEIHNKHKNLNS